MVGFDVVLARVTLTGGLVLFMIHYMPGLRLVDLRGCHGGGLFLVVPVCLVVVVFAWGGMVCHCLGWLRAGCTALYTWVVVLPCGLSVPQ